MEWKDACEWNPETNQAAEDWEVHGEARWVVGTGKNNWHLCDKCKELPKFKRFKKKLNSSIKKGDQSMPDTEESKPYVPYGDEWVEEMKKLTKMELIMMIKNLNAKKENE